MARNAPFVEPRKAAPAVGVVVAALAYSWIAAGFHPFTWPMRVAVLVPVVGALIVAWRPLPQRAERPEERVAGLVVWGTLLVLLVAWELLALFQSPREDHPTLSSISDDVMSVHAGRALMFAVWLGAGWILFVMSRRRR